MPTELNVVFQGGGAKLVTLLAAAEALQNLENDAVCTIEEIRGVSAGAIVAAMVASGDDIVGFRGVLLKEVPRSLRYFQLKARLITLAWRAYRGKALLPEKKMKDIFVKLFAGKTLKQLKKPIRILTAELPEGKRKTYSTKDNLPIVDALTDSCALPFAFRTYKSTQQNVDGGICSNLPVDLDQDFEKNFQILAFSFEPAENTPAPKNALRYALNLLSASIDNNVEAVVSRIKQSGGEVIELPNRFRLEQFQEAFEFLHDQESYSNQVKKFEQDIRRRLNNLKRRKNEHAAYSDLEADKNRIWDLSIAFQKLFPYVMPESTTVITARCMWPKGDGYSPDDHKIRRDKFAPINGNDQGLKAILVGLTTAAEPPRPDKVNYSVIDKNGDELKYTNFMVRKAPPAKGGKYWYYDAVFFHDIVPPHLCPITVAHSTHQRHLMKPLIDNGIDYISYIAQGKKEEATTYNIILQYPVSNDIEIVDLLNVLDQFAKNKGPSHIHVNSTAWTAGKQMSHTEITEAAPGYGEAGANRVGWKVTNAPNGNSCGCAFRVRSQT